jgi:Flp pilus assembly pilin Flp
MSIITFVLISVFIIAIVPSLAVFICCVLLGMIKTVLENIQERFKNGNFSKVQESTIITKTQIRAEAGKIFLNRIHKDEDTKVH